MWVRHILAYTCNTLNGTKIRFTEYKFITVHFVLSCTEHTDSGPLWLSCIRKILGLCLGLPDCSFCGFCQSLHAITKLASWNRLQPLRISFNSLYITHLFISITAKLPLHLKQNDQVCVIFFYVTVILIMKINSFSLKPN